jgi:hypothetical protein
MARKRRSHKIGKTRKVKKSRKSGKKMPEHVLAHFLARTLETAKRRGITPKLLPKRRRR